MPEPKTLAECLDAARDGQEFGDIINKLFTIAEAAKDRENQQ